MKPTLISHFYNEEFLLPFWIKHHKPMFDHAVMIDYGSTDRSVEIIKELAPEWEIVPTVNEYFDGLVIDKEVMAIEMQFDGWKTCLNTTEFLLVPDLVEYLTRFESEHPDKGIVRTTAAYMVDDEKDMNSDVNFNKHLVMQRTWGYFEEDILPHQIDWHGDGTHMVSPPRKSRLIHKMPHGNYKSGRHNTNYPDKLWFKDPELILCWFNWSPFMYISDRKVNIWNKTSPQEQRNGHKKWLMDEVEMFQKQALHHATMSGDLMNNSKFRNAYNAFKHVRGNEEL